MVYTNYNELMHKALMIAKERGVREQADFMKIVYEVFKADDDKKHN